MSLITPSIRAETADFSIHSIEPPTTRVSPVDFGADAPPPMLGRAGGLGEPWPSETVVSATTKLVARAVAFGDRAMIGPPGGVGDESDPREGRRPASDAALREEGCRCSFSSLLQERPPEQDGLVEDVDHVAEQDVGEPGVAALDAGPDLGPRPKLLVPAQEVLAHRVAEPDRDLHDVLA